MYGDYKILDENGDEYKLVEDYDTIYFSNGYEFSTATGKMSHAAINQSCKVTFSITAGPGSGGGTASAYVSFNNIPYEINYSSGDQQSMQRTVTMYEETYLELFANGVDETVHPPVGTPIHISCGSSVRIISITDANGKTLQLK